MDLRRLVDQAFTIEYADCGDWGSYGISVGGEYAQLRRLMNGVVEVRVEGVDEALRCACGLRIPVEEWVVERLRMRCDRRMFRAVCLFCLGLRVVDREREGEGRGER